MNKENLNNSETNVDMFPKVTQKYLKLWETYNNFCKEVRVDLFPMVKSVDDSLTDVYKIVAKEQKLLDKNCAYVEGYCWWNWAGKPRNYLYWGEKEKGLELVQIASHHEKNLFPESNDFVGFDKVKQWGGVNRCPLMGEVNIPSIGWQEIEPVLYRYDWVTNDSFEKIKDIEGVNEARDKYWKAKEYTEISLMKMVEDRAPEIRQKILDLNQVILEIPQIKDQIPEYLAARQGALMFSDKHEDIFFLPKSGQLVRAPVELIGPLKKVGKKPILENAYEAELADWVRIGLTMKWKMIEPVEKIGWVKPKYI